MLIEYKYLSYTALYGHKDGVDDGKTAKVT